MNSTMTLDTASGVPFYRQIIQQVEHAILAGTLLPGDRLPTIRALSVELKINPNTIAKAYGELELRGIVTTQVGSGTYVSVRSADIKREELMAKIEERIGVFIRELRNLGIPQGEAAELVRTFKEEA